MNVQRALRSRWLPGILAVGIALLAGFYAYKIYSRTRPNPKREEGAGMSVLAPGASLDVPPWPGSKKGDFRHFFYAGQAVNEGRDIYAAGEKGYIYPPLFAAIMSPLARLEPTTAERVWAAVNALMIAGIVGIAFLDAVRRFGIPSDRATFLGVSLVALLLSVEQVRWELEMGQTDTIVLLGFTLGLFWLDRRPVLAGVALGLAANIKYQSLVALPYLLIRRRYRAAAATAGAAVAWALLPALVTGWQRNVQYLATALRGLSRLVGVSAPGEAADMNPLTWEASVSLPSAAARLLGPMGFGTSAVLGVVALIAAGVVADYWIVFRRSGVPLLTGRTPERDGARPFAGVVALEWYGLIVAVLVFSPQSMVRHSFLLLSMNVLVAALILVPRVGVWRWPLVVGATVFQMGTKLPPGEDMFDRALATWRSFGGASWCMLVMYASLLWVGLAYARAVAAGRALVYPPAGGGLTEGAEAALTGGEP